MFSYSGNHFKKHGQLYETVTQKNFVTLNSSLGFGRESVSLSNPCSSIKLKILIFFTVAECDIMGRVITQTRG